METIKEYINIDAMTERLASILKETRDGLLDDDHREWLLSEWDDERIEGYACEMAYEFNDDMGKYLNLPDHKIDGNFNNIDYDYPPYRKNICGAEYDREMVADLVKRLNDGDMSEQSVKDRDWLVDWFFDTFGTWGIGYNFSSFLSEEMYYHEKEEEAYA